MGPKKQQGLGFMILKLTVKQQDQKKEIRLTLSVLYSTYFIPLKIKKLLEVLAILAGKAMTIKVVLGQVGFWMFDHALE